MARESRYPLRLPPELYEFVKNEAEKSDKSMNEYIVFVLREYHHLLGDIEKRIVALEAKIEDRTTPSDIATLTAETGKYTVTGQDAKLTVTTADFPPAAKE